MHEAVMPAVTGGRACHVFCGNRCSLDGSYFDEGGICQQGHWMDQQYASANPVANATDTVQPSGRYDPDMVMCAVFGGNLCTVCHASFVEGMRICINRHEFGKSYPRLH